MNKFADLAKMQDEVPESMRAHYAQLPATAAGCIGCASCEPNCPFGVPIAARMAVLLLLLLQPLHGGFPASKAGTATSIVAAANGVAVTVSSYLLMGSIAATGGTSLTVYPYFGAALIAVGVVSAITLAASRTRR